MTLAAGITQSDKSSPIPVSPGCDPVGAFGTDRSDLADIYDVETNIAVWKRPVPVALAQSLAGREESWRGFQTSMTVSPQSTAASLTEVLPAGTDSALGDDIAELVDMFCCLFDLKRAGLRFAHLSKAMCPRFHIDHIPCRLVTTYFGETTQWLPHDRVDHSKLGAGSNGSEDACSGLYPCESDIQSLRCGEVALLKGKAWEGNEHGGLVHRSPAVQSGKGRLLLTLDFAF